MKKKTKRRVILGVAAAGVVALVSGVLLYANSFRNYELIYPNVTCDGVPLAGMTYEEAESTIAGIGHSGADGNGTGTRYRSAGGVELRTGGFLLLRPDALLSGGRTR